MGVEVNNCSRDVPNLSATCYNFVCGLFGSQSIHEKLGTLRLKKKRFWNTLMQGIQPSRIDCQIWSVDQNLVNWTIFRWHHQKYHYDANHQLIPLRDCIVDMEGSKWIWYGEITVPIIDSPSKWHYFSVCTVYIVCTVCIEYAWSIETGSFKRMVEYPRSMYLIYGIRGARRGQSHWCWFSFYLGRKPISAFFVFCNSWWCWGVPWDWIQFK